MTLVDRPSEQTRSFARSAAAQRRLHALVPGGAHTYARASDQYPEGMAPVIVRGSGARVLDLDGNWLVEYGMGLRSVTLGHAYEPVTQAVLEASRRGVCFSRPSVWELEAAETFLAQVPGTEMVKFAKNGSDVTTAAVKLARAATGRELVAVCGTQPFFSVDDWFITATPMRAGIPAVVNDQTLRFDYQDIASLQAIFDAHDGRIAAVIMEPATSLHEPAPGYLEAVRALTTARGAVLIFDEMITGMRWSAAGAQAHYGVAPDLTTWGKALANGYAVSALAGRAELMALGGLDTDRSRVFLLSTTHGAESAGLAAYLAVASAYAQDDPIATMERQGARLATAVTAAAAEAGVGEHVTVAGRPSCLLFSTTDPQGRPSQAYRALFMQELLRHGVLGQSFVISAAHTDADLEVTVDAVRAACLVYARALEDGAVDTHLHGRPVAPALRELAAPRRLPDAVPPEPDPSPRGPKVS